MNIIRLNILPSNDTNDHQVRIEIDGRDYLPGELGLDPNSFFAQKQLFSEGILRTARCYCGVEGCGDSGVKVKISGKTVVWEEYDGNKLEFSKDDYFNYIESVRNDHSWETVERRVERLVGELLNHTTYNNEYKFEWASCRIEKSKIVLSYVKKDDNGHTSQKLIKINWNNKNIEDALLNAQELIEQNRIKKQTT